MRTSSIRAWFMAVLSVTTAALTMWPHGPSATSTCFASQGRKCACPMAQGEQLLIACASVLDPQSCGVCSVMSADGTRDGRSCIALP